MPRVSQVKLKGGEMRILPILPIGKPTTMRKPKITLARLQGGKLPSKKHRSNIVNERVEKRPKQRRVENEGDLIKNMSGRELQHYLDAKNREGTYQRNALGSTRDVLLQEILGSMNTINNREENTATGITQEQIDQMGDMEGGGMTVGAMIGGKLDKLVKNDMRLKHLRDMGVNVDSYSPYLIKAVVDGDYRSFRTTNSNEWRELVNECAIRGVQVNIMGRKTEFGKNLDGFLRNGQIGGSVGTTDDRINYELLEQKPNISRQGLEGGSLTPALSKKIKHPTKDEIMGEIISMSINLGYNPAIDLLNSYKSMLSKSEYAEMYVYLGQNSLP
tara:strand:- start:959 stop:1951 length:993 start_codon:yes stop_codon:yes gene_type:complete